MILLSNIISGLDCLFFDDGVFLFLSFLLLGNVVRSYRKYRQTVAARYLLILFTSVRRSSVVKCKMCCLIIFERSKAKAGVNAAFVANSVPNKN